ncbi:MAG: TatD family hydrolase [Gemmatimonadota bacterium]
MYFDTHCHLTAEPFQGQLTEVLVRAQEAGVRQIICIASDLADADDVLALIRDHGWLRGTAGIHPHAAGSSRAGDMDRLEEMLRANPGLVAVGEMGLDYHYDFSPRDVQLRVFREQLGVAGRVGLPVVVHCREADRDMEAILRDEGREVRGVLHCFDGDEALLEAALEAGWYVSFTGMVTFRSYAKQELVRAVPADRIMAETDAPYMAPVPHRGKRNEPAWVVEVCAGLAHILGEPLERVALRTTGNARRFFSWDEA